MPSPLCTVADGASAPQVTPPFATVTPGATVTLALASSAGVNAWSIVCVGTDETTAVAGIVLTVNAAARTATFVAPAAGKAMIFRSTVNGGSDANGTAQPSYATTFKVATLTANGRAVAALNEAYEHHATYGWTGLFNESARASGGGGAPSGTAGGSLGGTYPNPTVTKVDIAGTTGQVLTHNGTLWAAAGAPAPSGAAGGSLAGTYPNPTVARVDGAAGVLPISCAQTKWDPGGAGAFDVLSDLLSVQTTSASPTAIWTYAMGDARLADIAGTIVGYRPSNGDCYRVDIAASYKRFGGAAPAVFRALALSSETKDSGASAWTITMDVSGNTVRIIATGVASVTINWTPQISVQERT